jgi:hypothetical protein
MSTPPSRIARSFASRIIPTFACLLLVATLAPTVATAQTPAGGTGTIVSPVRGNYTDIYLVAGRAVDALGGPAVGADLTLTIDQANTNAKPLHAKADCFGVFIAYFTIQHVDPSGTLTVTLSHPGAPDATNTTHFDPFYRRSDVLLQYQGKWDSTCPDQSQYFPARISVQGRIVNRTEPYTVGGETYDAVPYSGHVSIRWIDARGHSECPQPPQGTGCQTQPVDERGDFRYSFVFDQTRPFNATGFIEVQFGNMSWNFTVDPLYRAAIARIDVSGRGPPTYVIGTKPTPDAPMAVAIAVVAVAAISLRLRRR